MRVLLLFIFFFASTSFGWDFHDAGRINITKKEPVLNMNHLQEGNKTSFAVWGDFDLDGDSDLYVVNDGAPNALYRNNYCSRVNPCHEKLLHLGGSPEATADLPAPLFTEASLPENRAFFFLQDGVSASKAAYWEDVDGDGDLDLYLVNDGVNRLFINNLFTPEDPYNPFLKLEEQISQDHWQNAGFTYKESHEFQLRREASQATYAAVVDLNEKLAVLLNGNAPNSTLVGDLFTAGSGVNFIRSAITPGMYLHLTSADISYRFPIIDVLTENQLRIQRPFRFTNMPSFPPTNNFFIVEDIANTLDSLDIIPNCTLTSVSGNRAYYQCPKINLTKDYHLNNDDRLIFTQNDQSVMVTLNFISGDSFGVSPPPSIDGENVVDKNFKVTIRRRNGEVVKQVYLRDSNDQVELSKDMIYIGDIIHIILAQQAKNHDRRLEVKEMGDEGTVFIVPLTEAEEVEEEINLVYDLVYNSGKTVTKRYLENSQAKFTASDEVAHNRAKIGDHIIINPSLSGVLLNDQGGSQHNLPTNLRSDLRQYQYSDGDREGGVLEILDIISDTKILVDAYPSEVGLPQSYRNSDFTYQLRHRFGSLKRDPNPSPGDDNWYTRFAEKAPLINGQSTNRDFLLQMGIELEHELGDKFGSQMILRKASISSQNIVIDFSAYISGTVGNVKNHTLRLTDREAATSGDGDKDSIEYRPVFYGFSINPYKSDGKIIRIPKEMNVDAYGLAAGDYIFLRRMVDGMVNTTISERILIEDVKKQDNYTELTLRDSPPMEIRAYFEGLCAKNDDCDYSDDDSTNKFFATFPDSLGKIDYEFISGPPPGEGFEVSCEVNLDTTVKGGFPALGLTELDAVEFSPPLSSGTDFLYGAFIKELIEVDGVKSRALLDISDAIDAPFNEDKKSLGFVPVYLGKITDYRRVTRELSTENKQGFLDLASPGDWLLYFRRDFTTGFAPSSVHATTYVTRVQIRDVDREYVDLGMFLYDALGVSEEAASDTTSADFVNADNFFFRIVRSTGRLFQKTVFIDRRENQDFGDRLLLDENNNIRGTVLLDLYLPPVGNENSLSTPLEKRFRPRSLVYRNMLEIEGVQASDIASGYFYELQKHEREKNVLVPVPENDKGFGQKAEFADWTYDGKPDLYILNRASGAKSSSWDYSVLHIGSHEPEVDTVGFRLLDWESETNVGTPVISPSNVSRLLKNMSYDEVDSVKRLGLTVRALDFNGDLLADLLIWNGTKQKDTSLNEYFRESSGRIFMSSEKGLKADDMQILDYEAEPLINLTPSETSLLGLNAPAAMNQAHTFVDLIIGQINNDRYDDVFMINRPSQTITGNPPNFNIFLGEVKEGGGVSFRRFIPNSINYTELLNQQKFYSRTSGQMIDLNSDGFVDVSLLTKAAHYALEPFLLDLNSVSTPKVSEFSCGGITNSEDLPYDLWPNHYIAWADFNFDGYPDYYVARQGNPASENVICISLPPEDSTSSNFFALKLITRNLFLRRDTTRPVFMGRLTLTDTTNPLRTFIRNFKFSYPFPQRLIIGTGSVEEANIKLEWSDKSVYDYGNFFASSINRKEITLIQPTDYQIIAAESGRFTAPTTWVGPTTTNIEALSFKIMPSMREPLVIKRLSTILRSTAGSTGDLLADGERTGKIPEGSIKLYIDSSEQSIPGTNLARIIPDGIYNADYDILLATGELKSIDEAEQYYYINDSGIRITNQFYQAEFNIDGFIVPGYPKVDSLELPQSVPDSTPVSVTLLMVFTFDNVTDAKILRFNLSKRIGFGLEDYFLEAEQNSELSFSTASPYNVTYDIEAYGKNTGLLHRAVPVADNITPLPTITELSGREIKVDITPPNRPSVDSSSYQTNEFHITISGRIVRRPVDREGDITIRARNITKNNEPIFLKVPYGQSNWSLLITELFEGENEIEINAMDEFANASERIIIKVWVDTIPPEIDSPLVSNINITKANILWNTDEKAIGGIRLRSVYADQYFSELKPHLLRDEHSLEVGQSRQLYYNYATDEKCIGSTTAAYYARYVPKEEENKNIRYSGQALCPDTVYTADIYARDALGNLNELLGAITFKTLPITQQTVTIDGIEYEDADGDGIPDIIEWSDGYPDLDPFDANDALLDFDDDGISNIEEFLAGTDMYDPFDSLPIPNAGIDQVSYPGIIYLNAEASNFNNLPERDIVFKWKIESAPGTTLETHFPPIFNSNAKKAFFAARNGGDYIVTLALSNQRGASPKEDSLRVTILNVPPVADAGPNGFGKIDDEIPLDGRNSMDANGDELTYRWIQTRGPSLSAFPQDSQYGLFDTTSALAYFKTDKVGEYAFDLFVTEKESERKTNKSRVFIQVNSNNDIFPLANAGHDFKASINTLIKLDGGFSKGRSANTTLKYEWSLITPNAYNVAERCVNTAVAGQEAHLEWENSKSRSQRFPELRIKEPGVYAFNLQVEEMETGLKALPSCVQIFVEKSSSPDPIANPKNDGAPQALQKLISTSQHRIAYSRGRADLPDYNTIRTPVNYEVQLNGAESFTASKDKNVCHDNNDDWSTALCPHVTSDCLKLEQTPFPYEWQQVAGEAVTLKPVYYDCSVVRFTPIVPGIYSFELSVNTRDPQNYVKRSLPQPINIIAGDYNKDIPEVITIDPESNEEVASSNRFIPYIKAGKDIVIHEGTVTFSEPKCLDEDLQTSDINLDDDSFFEYVYPENELQACSVFTELSCVWQQVAGPSALLSSNTDCAPSFNAKPGTYTFAVRAFDGQYYSLPDEVVIVVIPTGETAPVAIAQPVRSAVEGDVIYLSGSASVSAQKGFRYVWTQKRGLPAMLVDSHTRNPYFLARKRGNYYFELQIEDANNIYSLPAGFEIMVQRAESRIVDPVVAAINAQQNFELEGGGGTGGCFIVTAASGSADSWLVRYFQTFRDLVLQRFSLGRRLMNIYYHLSPPIADYIAIQPLLRLFTLVTLIFTAILINPIFWLACLIWGWHGRRKI